jgi:tetratricopeptide (TPR) repeat protein
MGMSSGRFIIKVLPLGRDLLEQEQDVEVNNQVMQSDTVFVDFHLRPSKRSPKNLPNAAPEAIFVQDVPENARKLYETGVSNLEKNQDKGLAEIEEAIKIFPNYFEALSRLGKEYVARKDYNKAYPYLIKAIDVNQRSASCYYSLGYAFFQLKEIPAALEATKAVIILNPASVEGHLLYGTILRISGDYQNSEKILLKAKSLSKQPYAEIHWQLALVLNKLNRNKEAANELEAYLKISPESPDKKEVKDLISKLRTSKQS